MREIYLTLKTKLVRLMLKQKWGKAYQFLKTKHGIEQATRTDSVGLSALTIALTNRPPISIVEKLLEIKSSLSLEVDNCGMLPLHMACKCGASAEVILRLLEHDNGATAATIDTDRRTPLHYSAKYLCDPFDLQQSSISSNPMSVASGSIIKNNTRQSRASKFSSGRLSAVRNPINGSVQTDGDMSMTMDEFQEQFQVIQLLLSVAPHAVLFVDLNEETPIDVLQDCKSDHNQGPKWERADIVCEVMREVAIRIYVERKQIWESNRETSTVDSSCGSINEESSLNNFETMLEEVDSIAYSRMDISLPCQNDR